MQDHGVNWGGLLWGERGTPARKIHLIVHWDVREPVGAKMIDGLALCNRVFCDLGGGDEWHAAPLGAGALLLYWGDVLEFTVESSVSELEIWKF